MRRYLFILAMLVPSSALAQILAPVQAVPSDIDKGATICMQHRHFAEIKGPDHKVIYDTGWEHCAELLDLKVKADKAKEVNDVALTKRALEQLKGPK